MQKVERDFIAHLQLATISRIINLYIYFYFPTDHLQFSIDNIQIIQYHGDGRWLRWISFSPNRLWPCANKIRTIFLYSFACSLPYYNCITWCSPKLIYPAPIQTLGYPLQATIIVSNLNVPQLKFYYILFTWRHQTFWCLFLSRSDFLKKIN